jgi:hypothetical protein
LLLVDVVDGAGLGIQLEIVPPENAASPIVNVTDRVRRRYSIASAPQGIAKGRLSKESAVLNLGAGLSLAIRNQPNLTKVALAEDRIPHELVNAIVAGGTHAVNNYLI